MVLSEHISGCVCFRSCIFYRACVDIPRGTELLVWYNDSYTSFFGIPLQCIAQDENCKTLLSFVDVPDVNVTVTAECCICEADLALSSTSLDFKGEVVDGVSASRVNLCPFSSFLGLLCFFSSSFSVSASGSSVSVTNLFLLTSSPVFCSVSLFKMFPFYLLFFVFDRVPPGRSKNKL